MNNSNLGDKDRSLDKSNLGNEDPNSELYIKVPTIPKDSKTKKSRIIIITTGGTIEKSYDENDGLLINRSTLIESRVLPHLRLPYSEIEIRPVLSKDSLYMDDRDRHQLTEMIAKTMEDGHPIVILHGTDTVDKTTRFCCQHISNPKVAVVFTGAMRPLELEETDGIQNIIEALMVVRLLPPGFYLSFHNNLYLAPYFKKNRKQGTFEAFLGE